LNSRLDVARVSPVESNKELNWVPNLVANLQG
jgi:hypothetical protein